MYTIEFIESINDDIEEVTQHTADSKMKLLNLWSELFVLNARKNYRIYENNVVKLEGIMCPADFAELEKWEEPVKSSCCENGACEIF